MRGRDRLLRVLLLPATHSLELPLFLRQNDLNQGRFPPPAPSPDAPRPRSPSVHDVFSWQQDSIKARVQRPPRRPICLLLPLVLLGLWALLLGGPAAVQP